jgi:hypothetical protein
MAMTSLRAVAGEAWIYCLPLIEMARQRRARAEVAGQDREIGAPCFTHGRALSSPAIRRVTSPNVDTLYSHVFIDLGSGPAEITLPATGNRYCSLQLFDMYTNTVAVLGTRTTGGDGGTFTLVGPRDAAPDSAIRAPTPWIWAVVRLGVGEREDLGSIHRLQDGFALQTGPARGPGLFAGRTAPWQEYFASAAVLLEENPPPVTDLALLRRIAPLGVGPSCRFDVTNFTAAEIGEIEKGVVEALDTVMSAETGKSVDGWVYPGADLGDFGQNYLYRGRIAIAGLGALPRQEAMYMWARAPDGSIDFDEGSWRLHFPAGGLPPVNAFWSLTMYETMPDGQAFLTRNPIGRYAIGDRTQGLKRNADGSLDIWIDREDPGGDKTANWLPAPASGPYRMIMRTYLPRPELLTGAYLLPPLTPA